MQRRSTRLQVVLTLAEQEALAVAGQLQKLQDQIRQEQQQLNQLRDFSQDYTDRIRDKRFNVSGSTLENERTFLGKLTTADNEQQQTLARLFHLQQQLQGQWQVKYQRKEAIADLIAKYRLSEDMDIQKKLQAEIDDLALRNYHQKMDSGD